MLHDVAVTVVISRHCCLPVDFFPFILADIGNPEITARGIKRLAPGVSQSTSPDFSTGILGRPERIVFGVGITGGKVSGGKRRFSGVSMDLSPRFGVTSAWLIGLVPVVGRAHA